MFTTTTELFVDAGQGFQVLAVGSNVEVDDLDVPTGTWGNALSGRRHRNVRREDVLGFEDVLSSKPNSTVVAEFVSSVISTLETLPADKALAAVVKTAELVEDKNLDALRANHRLNEAMVYHARRGLGAVKVSERIAALSTITTAFSTPVEKETTRWEGRGAKRTKTTKVVEVTPAAAKWLSADLGRLEALAARKAAAAEKKSGGRRRTRRQKK